MFKQKLGICLYEENYYEEEIIKIQDEEPVEEIFKVSNEKSTKELIKESDKELIKKLDEYSDEESDNESIEESTTKLTKELIKESTKKSNKESVNKSNKDSIERPEKSEEEFIEDLKKIFSLNNKSTTNWYDKNKFNKILTTIDSNNFNHENKIGNNLINNIKNNTISEADTKKKINELNEIKKLETKGKRVIDSQKPLLN